MTLRCPHPHIPPFDAVALPDPKRPGWARLICRQCGTFIGYQAPEEIATEFAQSLPAPDENGQLPTLHYGHTGALQELRDKLAEASALADAWGKL